MEPSIKSKDTPMNFSMYEYNTYILLGPTYMREYQLSCHQPQYVLFLNDYDYMLPLKTYLEFINI